MELKITPKFTIVTPSFNQGKFIEETILSVITQDYPNIEYIVIDGGSTDNSVEIIKKYETKINYWISEKDKGQSHAINKGLKKCSGEYIMWLNSDDVLLPGAISRAATLFEENPNVVLIHGKSILFGESIPDTITGEYQEHFNEKYLAYIPFPQPSSFFKRSVIDDLGFIDVDLHYGMDFDLLTRIALNYDILFVNETFSKYRIHKDSKTNNSIKFAEEWQKIFSKTLRTLKNTEKYIGILKKLEFYFEGSDYHEKVNKFPKNFELTFLYFLNNQMHYYYQANNYENAHKISSEIRNLNQDFYLKNKADVISKRAQFPLKYMISFYRKLFPKTF